MPAGDQITHNMAADAGTNAPGISPYGGSGFVALSAMTNKKPDTRQTSFRTVTTADSGTPALNNAAYTAAPFLVKDSQHIWPHVRFSVAGASITIFYLLLDGQKNVIGPSRDYTYQGDSTFTVDGVNYGSTAEPVDVGPATYVFPVVRTAISSGTGYVIMEPL